MTLNELLAFQAGADLIAKSVDDKGEVDIKRLADHADITCALVNVLAGPDAADEPLHLVMRRIRETLPQRINDIADYIEKQLEPELAQLSALLKPFTSGPQGA